jgi:hypothetical protein
MAGCLGGGEGGNVSPDSVRRWTEKLSNVLLSSTARHKFHDYLKSRHLEQGQSLLEFWEKCDIFLIQAEKSGHHSQERTPERNARSTTMKQEAQLITEFADSNINFDPAQMQALYTAAESEDKQTIMRAISQAKQSATEMLEEEGYQEFCRYLLKGQGMLKDKC